MLEEVRALEEVERVPEFEHGLHGLAVDGLQIEREVQRPVVDGDEMVLAADHGEVLPMIDHLTPLSPCGRGRRSPQGGVG